MNRNLSVEAEGPFAINEMVRREVEKFKETKSTEFSEVIKKTGLSQPYFSIMMNWRTSKRAMPAEHAVKILVACDMPLSQAQAMVVESQCKMLLSNLDPRTRRLVVKTLSE